MIVGKLMAFLSGRGQSSGSEANRASAPRAGCAQAAPTNETAARLPWRSPYGNGIMSMPPPARTVPAAGAPPSRPAGRRYPINTAVQVAGVALHNTFMAGPSNPTQPTVHPRPEGPPPSITVLGSDAELIHAAQAHAAEAGSVLSPGGLGLDARTPAGVGNPANGRRSLLQKAGRTLCKVGRQGGRALGLVAPAAPTLASVLKVGRGPRGPGRGRYAMVRWAIA